MRNQPNEELRYVARMYNYAHVLQDIVEGHDVPVDEQLAIRIVAAYEALPAVQAGFACAEAYVALGHELEAQWKHLLAYGYTLEPWTQEGQPYATSAEMRADVQAHKHLYFFTGGDIHPFLGVETDASGLTLNDKFRAVHDCFGHAAEGFQFGPRGEENAWIHHCMMLSPVAVRALSVETRGQNSWFNYGPHRHLPACERPFAAQKCALLPRELTDWQAALARA